MEVLFRFCCGIDVHKKIITVCIITPCKKLIRSFGTMTLDLLELIDWLIANKCTHVAMESTGVYWKPLYNILEGTDITIFVVNAQHIKAVPGRKTDVKDAEWICELMRHGLLKSSYIPGREQRELRELVRYRRSLIEERAREANRIQKILEGANIKLGDVVTDILGKSSRDILNAIISGNTNVEEMAQLARGRMKSKTAVLAKALKGLIGSHQRDLLESQLAHVDFLDEQITKRNAEIEARMHPYDEAIDLLDSIPGIGRRTCEQILCEIGLDMSRFPSHRHLASWAGLCPGNNESAGKRKRTKTRKGNLALKVSLTQAAKSISHTKGNYLSSLYHRLSGKKGKNKATIAVAHALLIIIYHMLKNGTPYQDLGPNHYDKINAEYTARKAVKRLENLGYKVTLEPVSTEKSLQAQDKVGA